MTIVGNGDIAMALREGGIDSSDLTFFCSGVSNSQETRESEYQREIDLLLEQNCYHLIYFSSLCIFYSNSRYARHKRLMEEWVKGGPQGYTTILRMGNITWGNNPHTLINTLRERERLGLPQNIQDVYRYIVDKDEFLHWVCLIPDTFNCEMNIPGRRLKVADIYHEFVLGERVTA